MLPINKIDVFYHSHHVGTIARSREGLFPFEYSDSWLAEGFPLNPLTLPLEKQVSFPRAQPLEGMFGVFFDSLPDGWGRLLVDRMLLKNRFDMAQVDDLVRLAIVGNVGMGALEYAPQIDLEISPNDGFDLDRLAQECSNVLVDTQSEDLDELYMLGGSSGGARPKIMTEIDGANWIIKFPSTFDPPNIGLQEYEYALCAQECGIEMPEQKLFPSHVHEGYFGVKRFDRTDEGQKVHMVSAAGLLETSHQTPNLDYLDLMKLVRKLTNDFSETKMMYRLMCFNVFAHNRDDHSKNFSFLYDRQKAEWSLSPAYDLTYSASIRGQHATTVAGNGIDPGIEDVLRVADTEGLSKSWAKETAETIKDKTGSLIKKYSR